MNTNITQTETNNGKQNDIALNMSQGVPLETMSQKCIEKLNTIGTEKQTKKEKKKEARKNKLRVRRPRFEERFKRHYTSKLSESGVARKKTLKEQGIDADLSADLASRGISDAATANDTISNLVCRYMSELRPINYAIAAKIHPVKCLTIDQMKTIKDEILRRVLTYDHPKIRPKFVSIKFIVEEGWIQLICADKSTENWMMSIRKVFDQKCGIDLKFVLVSTLCTSLRFVGFFRDSTEDKPKTIFQMLQAQNAGLHIDKWNYVTQKPFNNGTAELLFDIDDKSHETLKQNKFLLFYKFGSVHILPAQKLKDHNPPSDLESDNSGSEE